MKSVEYSHKFEKLMHLYVHEKDNANKLFAHYQLYNSISETEGYVVRCGISSHDVTGFALFRHFIVFSPTHKIIAFQKPVENFFYEQYEKGAGALKVKRQANASDVELIREQLENNRISSRYFIAGAVSDTIPHFLADHAEMKIAYLHIDLNDYDATMTALQFFYPRIIKGGILTVDNYHRLEEEYRAVTDYFCQEEVTINNFSLKQGPHYIIRG